MRRRDGCAVRISQVPDTRFFGSSCFATGDVSTLPELCQAMIENLKGSASYDYYFTVYPRDHVSLKVVGGISEAASGAAVLEQSELFSDLVEQFNWHDPRNPDNNRFRLCQVQFLSPELAAQVQLIQPVTVSSDWHLCPYPSL